MRRRLRDVLTRIRALPSHTSMSIWAALAGADSGTAPSDSRRVRCAVDPRSRCSRRCFMRGPIAVLALPSSTFGTDLKAGMDARGAASVVLSIDAVLDGDHVTIGSDAVLWQGFDLLTACAVFLETPIFAWPQPQGD